MAHLTFTYGTNKINFMFSHTVFTKINSMSDQRTTCPASHMFALSVSGEPNVNCGQKLTPFHRDKFYAGIGPRQFMILWALGFFFFFCWRFRFTDMVWCIFRDLELAGVLCKPSPSVLTTLQYLLIHGELCNITAKHVVHFTCIILS